MPYWSLHTHSRESATDALPSVARVAQRAADLGYPALGLTDHGSLSGAVEHYIECRKHGIQPLIGIEIYLAFDRLATARPDTMHACLVAYTEQGYRNICKIGTMTNRNFRWRPVLDLADLAELSESGGLNGLLMTSGCWFGLLPRMLREGHMSSAVNFCKALQQWFSGMFFIEIQNHCVSDDSHDDELHARLLQTFADAYELPTVITQDSHYLLPEDQKLHDAFKTLVSWSDNPDDAIFPGDGYHMVDTQWMREHHDPDIFASGMKGLELILSKANLVIPELDEYHLKTPDTTMSGDADAELSELSHEQLLKLTWPRNGKAAAQEKYRFRLDQELAVIRNSGFSGYLMLVKTVCDFMREHDIRYRVRGSATGSLVCWLIGITGYDPIKWQLSFERFLSNDRTKPPDIDLDVEHNRRQEVIDWLGTKFYTTQISTSMGFGVQASNDGDDPKGSLVVSYRMRQRKIGADPSAPISNEWFQRLEAIANYNGAYPDGTSIDPPLKSVGKHPAGVLIAPDAETLSLIPLRYVASSKAMVSAYDMHDVERLGLVKLDVLGLRTLTAVRIAEEIAEVRCEDFPLNDRVVYQRISRGETAGMFQLEGGTASYGVRRMRPRKISDVIAAMALFRPASRASGATDSYLARRQGVEQIPEHHELINRHTADTYGVLVYQEQALSILSDLGLTIDEIEKARKAIKASNANVGGAAQALKELMTRIKSLAKGLGMTVVDIDWLEKALSAYAGYSFNRAHATAYGVLAYQTAYMVVHHPLAFWTGTFIANEDAPANFRNIKPIDIYLKAARNVDGMRIRNAHVNISELSYSTDGVRIYKGLTSIPGVGKVASEELIAHQPYKSLDDLARKVSTRRVSGAKDLGKGHSPGACPGVIGALYAAGALEGLSREKEAGTDTGTTSA